MPLTRLTTWRLGGTARYLTRPRTPTQLAEDLAAARQRHLAVFAIGQGSNLLFPTDGYAGLLVRLPGGLPRTASGEPLGVPPERPSRRRGAYLVTVPAGASLAPTARHLARHGLSGLEWAIGIPGTIGGAVVNNAGAQGGEIAGVLEAVTLWHPTRGREVWPAARLALRYRTSRLKGREPTACFLLAASFRLRGASPARLARQMTRWRAERAHRTPRGPSCGSVFRNPTGEVAGRLIEEAGLAGLRCGGAEIARRHANFILNRGGAGAEEILNLIATARERVAARTGIRLALEVQLVGFGPSDPLA